MRFLLAIVLLIIPYYAHASAWMQGVGKGERIQTFSYFSSNTSFGPDGKETKNPKIVKKEISPYAEYGLTEDFTVGGALSIVSFSNAAATNNNDDFRIATADIFVRTPLWQNDEYIISIQPGVRIPVYAEAALNPEGKDPIPELKIAAGHGFKFLDGYSFAELGATYRWRKKERLEDMLKLDATLGVRVHEDVLVLNQLFHEESLNMDAHALTSGNYNLTKLQFSVAFDCTESLSLQAGIYKNIDGENTAAGNGLIFSGWYKF